MANPAAKPSAPRAAAAPPPAVAAPVAEKKKFNALYVIIPVVGVILIAVVVGAELFRAEMEARQQGQGGEEKLGVIGGPMGMQHERKSRELKPKEPVVAPPVSDDEDLTGLGKKKKPPPPKTYPPVEKAWRSVKGEYDKLEARNETTAKKYRMKVLTLEDRKTSVSEASFVKEAGALEDALRVELAKPENQ